MLRSRSRRFALSLSILASLALPAMARPLTKPEARPDSLREQAQVVLRTGIEWLSRIWANEGCLIDPGGVCRAEPGSPENEGSPEVRQGGRTFSGRWH